MLIDCARSRNPKRTCTNYNMVFSGSCMNDQFQHSLLYIFLCFLRELIIKFSCNVLQIQLRTETKYNLNMILVISLNWSLPYSLDETAR